MGVHHSLPLHSRNEVSKQQGQPYEILGDHLPAQIAKNASRCRCRKRTCDEQQAACLTCARIVQHCTRHHQLLQRDLSAGKPLLGCTWSPAASSLSHWPPNAHVALRPPKAALLFRHFMESMKPDAGFQLLPVFAEMTAVTPLLLRNRMAMHALLAVSASDLREAFPDAESQAIIHYGIAIRALRHEMTQFVNGKPADLPAMLLAIILLCSFEVLRGDEQNASSNHLHAVRYIIRAHIQDLRLHSDWDFLSFILDYYRHMSIAKYIISANEEQHGICDNRRSLMLGVQSIDELRRRLGFNFELSYPILADLPHSARLPNSRALSIYDGSLCFGDGENQAQPRKACPPGLKGNVAVAELLPPPAPATKMVRQISLLILLVVAHGSRPPDDSLLGKTNNCVEEFLRELAIAKKRHLVDAMMMWAYILLGSCARKVEHQAAVEFALRNSRFNQGFVEAMVALLRDMWSDKDDMAFGPFGIKRALALHNLRFMSLIPSK